MAMITQQNETVQDIKMLSKNVLNKSLLLNTILLNALNENLFGIKFGHVYLSVSIQMNKVSKGNTTIAANKTKITLPKILFFFTVSPSLLFYNNSFLSACRLPGSFGTFSFFD
jgi:hypothetical protein